jgi:hypothetical protein
MSSISRETIHVSLGPSANAITAHLLNLQGLAATDAESTCNPNITHAVANETYVPRVLIVDQASRFSTFHQSPQVDESVATWNGPVHVEEQEDDQVDKTNTAALQEAASALAYSSYSRYHVSSNPSVFTSASNGRHVNWNDLGEEEEEEDPAELARRQERAKQKWQLYTRQPLEEQLDSFWKDTPHDSLSWMDYWMPPRPPYHHYAVPLAFSNDSLMQQHWDTYHMGTTTAEDLLETFRKLLETCDSVQGVTILSQGHGIYAGLTSALLQDLEQECRTAGRLVMNVTDNTDASDKENDSSKEQGWQPAHAIRVRRQLQSGLALFDFSSRAHAVLPLSLNTSKESSLFAASAQVALALETATLAYRLNGSNSRKSRVGLNGGFYSGVGPSDEGYGIASSLSFGEYLACLQPSPQYSLLELEIMTASDNTWNQTLFQGTSLERQQMLQRGGRDANVTRPRDVLPGAWLDSNTNNGYMTSLSPETGSTSRSIHHQFALTSSLRPSKTNVSTFSTSQYLTFLMEGMAFRYRPEVSMGTVVGKSASTLTSGGYGAGSYWKHLFSEGDKSPVLSVLSNSTRSYGYLTSVSSGMEQVLSPRFKGYLNRDTAEGILPDAEDCMEAMEKCLDLRDSYAPPEGSGLRVDSEGTYFDVDS